MKIKVIFLSIIVFTLLLTLTSVGLTSGREEIKIGVLAHRGYELALLQYQPLADYLTKSIPTYSFSIVPLKLQEISVAVASREIDLLITNPTSYVEVEILYGVSHIATLSRIHEGKIIDQTGSLIFTRKDRNDINNFKDLIGKTIMAVGETAFSGWQIAWKEFVDVGINPLKDFKKLLFSGFPQDQVVFAVRDGLADVGVIKTGILEALIRDGMIELSDFKVINPKSYPNFHQLVSTRLYPEGVLAGLPHTSIELAKKVVIQLFSLPLEHPALMSAEIASFTIPDSYQTVKELLLTLRLPPYEDYGKFTVKEVFYKYWPLFMTVILLFLFFIFLIINLRKSTIKLREVNEKLKELDNLKSLFIASMSHELRTPLNSIIGFSSIILDEWLGPLNEEQKENLSLVLNSGKYLLSLINEIIDVAKIEAGTIELYIEELELKELIQELVKNMSLEVEKRGLLLKLNLNPINITTDRKRLTQSLYNLMSNALKFTEIGFVEISNLNHPDYVEISVEDTGKGMSPEEINKLFTPFTRFTGNSGIQSSGVGLGLYLTKKIIEDILQGKLLVESEKNKGSKFTIILPIKLSTEKDEGTRV